MSYSSQAEVTTPSRSIDGFITIKEAALFAGVTRTAIQYAIHRGDIDAVHISRMWLVKRKSLEKYRPRALRPRQAA